MQLRTGKDNQHASGLIPERLQGVDAVIDFTTPGAVLENMQACIRNRTPMVVGTTGWYERLGEIEMQVQRNGAAFLYASNFSVGVNIFFAIAAAAAAGIAQGYVPKIVERHHAQKKDAPSGTAVSIRRIVEDIGKVQPEITSVREGDTIGSHVLLLDSPNDTMMLVHDAKNRRGFADGAVRAAEWLKGKTGFYEFQKIFGELPK